MNYLFQLRCCSLFDEEYDMDTVKGWKTNILKDPLKDIGVPMTRVRTKVMKETLNSIMEDLKELEPNYIKESAINMSNKSPRKVVTILEAQQDDVQDLYGVHIEEITPLEDMQEWLVGQVNKHQISLHLILFESFILFP